MSYDSTILADAYQGNLTTLRELQLRLQVTEPQAAALCCVSPETYRRWIRDRTPNPTAVRLMAILAGYVPWPGWQDWEVHNGHLFPPGFTRYGLRPGHILAIPYQNQLVSLYQRQLRELRAGSGPARMAEPIRLP